MTPVDRLNWIEAACACRDLSDASSRIACYLATAMNGKTGQLNPSHSQIMKCTGLSKSSIKRAIKAIEKAGLLTVDSVGIGTGNRSNYRLVFQDGKGSPPDSLPESKGVATDPFKGVASEPLEEGVKGSPVNPKGVTSDPKPEYDLLDEQGKEQEGKPKGSNLEIVNPDLFENFWVEYPNKKSKGRAEKAWEKLTAAQRHLAIKSLPAAKQSRQWLKSDGQFIPHPASWLNAKGFEDEYGEAEIDDGVSWYDLTGQESGGVVIDGELAAEALA